LTLLALEPEWAGKHIELEASLPTTVIHADEELVGHIWTNLLGNAIKFTPDGGQIHVTLIEQEERVICRIADTGIGIAPEALPRIFDRFYKADESRGLYAGSGLGLAIVAKIVERSGGSIAVKSELGEGTVVSVTLPKGV
jgi:signal transduction histidine kinase